ncbi:efflux RND transporter permease subunit [Lentisphaerota bacterium WC36G]|nr:efflux RND transporter permease subunit [Lentisphaerae bacterium WC36]
MNYKSKKKFNLFQFLFVQRTIAWVAILIMAVAGYFSYDSLVKEYVPDIKIPQAIITTEWLGASPVLVEKEITVEIEKKIKEIEGIKDYYSGSRNSLSVIGVKFYDDIPMNIAMQKLQEKIEEAEAEFPKKVEKTRVEKISINDIPIVRAVLKGNADYKTFDKLSKKIKKKLERIKGIKKVVLTGKRSEVILVQLYSDRLRMLGITPTLVHDILKRYENDTPIGRFEKDGNNFFLKLTGSLQDTDIIRKLPIKRTAGHVVRLDEIAKVSRRLDKVKTIAMLNTKEGSFEPILSINILKMPGKDTVRLVEKVKEAITQLRQQKDWPNNINYEIVADESELIFESLEKSFKSAWQAFLIVFLILFMMLSWREAIIASTAIPLTLLASIIIIWFLGYSFNIMVIIGVILALGLLVDDFILIMEGMHENFYIKKLSFANATKRTIQNYAIPSLSGSLTTVMVFIPLALIPGVDGKFLRLIPVTTAVCLIMSYFISIFIAVPLSGLLLKDKLQNYIKLKGPSTVDRISKKIEIFLLKTLKNYILTSRLRAFSYIVMSLVLFILFMGAKLVIPSRLYADEDSRNIGITVEFPADTTIEQTTKYAKEIGDELAQKKYFKYVTKNIGKKDSYITGSLISMMNETQAPYLLGFDCLLLPLKQRDKESFEYVDELENLVKYLTSNIAGSKVHVTAALGGPEQKDPIQIDITSNDLNQLIKAASQVQKALSTIPGAIEICNNLGQRRLEASFIPKREALDFYKINELNLALQLNFLWII